MELSDKLVKDFQTNFKKPDGTDYTLEEAREAGKTLMQYVEVVADIHAEQERKKELNSNNETV